MTNVVRLYSFEDMRIVALTLYGEARNQSVEGRAAVAWVIRNRVHSHGRWPNTYAGAAKQKKQFSCWNRGEVNNHAMLIVDLKSDVFRECYAIAANVMAGLILDQTGGANHYHTEHIRRWPKWAKRDRRTAHIEAHLFYRL